ncbi:hypothetical protein GQR58_012107 [Nymphon striatum]|nr:hypothetical protein GQR58_012107 [Nymphon striatum]
MCEVHKETKDYIMGFFPVLNGYVFKLIFSDLRIKSQTSSFWDSFRQYGLMEAVTRGSQRSTAGPYLHFGAIFIHTHTWEVYGRCNGWEQYGDRPEKSFLPIRVKKHFDFHGHTEPHNLTLISNMYDLNENEPDIGDFNVERCFTESKKKDFSFEFNGTESNHPAIEESVLQSLKNRFHFAIAEAAGVQPLRLQLYQIYRYYKNRYSIYARLHGPPKIYGEVTPKSRSKPVINLKQAISNLEAAIKDSKLIVELHLPKLFSKKKNPCFQKQRPVLVYSEIGIISTLNVMVSRCTVTPLRTSAWTSSRTTIPRRDGSKQVYADYN